MIAEFTPVYENTAPVLKVTLFCQTETHSNFPCQTCQLLPIDLRTDHFSCACKILSVSRNVSRALFTRILIALTLTFSTSAIS